MRNLITILARSGSKGLPHKHTMSFNGRPLVEWTIRQATQWAYFRKDTDVVVSSDSYVVLGIAKKYAAIPFKRSKELAQDDIGKVDAIREALCGMEKTNSQTYDLVIDLDATNPCRHVQNINECYHIFKKKQPKTLFSVTKSKKNPYFNQVHTNPTELVRKGFVHLTRQDSPLVYDVNSNIYVYDAEWLRDVENKFVITDNSEVYEMPDWTFCDIDSFFDFEVAEFLYEKHIMRDPGLNVCRIIKTPKA